MANSRGMTLREALQKASAFPPLGKPPIKVGGKFYPRSSSDDVPKIVAAAVQEILDAPDKFDLDPDSSDQGVLSMAFNLLIDMVWPGQHGTDTMHKYAARYVADWALDNGIDDVVMPDPVK